MPLIIILFLFIFSFNLHAEESMVYKSIKKGDIEVLTVNNPNTDNQLTKKEVEEFFINSQNEPMIISIYDTYGAVAEGELLYKGEKVKYKIDGGGWGTVNNTEKIMYKNLLELSYNFIGIDTTITNIDKYSDSDFYVKYRILLFDYYIKKKNKQNNTDNLYNNIKDMIESKKNVMISDYKNNKTNFNYYYLYTSLLNSIKKYQFY